jgi:hypothetical protein
MSDVIGSSPLCSQFATAIGMNFILHPAVLV